MVFLIDMEIVTIVGIIASLLTGMAQIPQLIKLVKEKNAEDLAVSMYIILIVGLSTWVWYAFVKTDWILFASNIFSVIINILLVKLIVKYKKK
ncbi:MAG: hypothetical protein LH615_09815 [Ferruginibacter sp.]|nr:hypothetical protein [Ferruginibacter sp.]